MTFVFGLITLACIGVICFIIMSRALGAIKHAGFYVLALSAIAAIALALAIATAVVGSPHIMPYDPPSYLPQER